MLTAVTTCMGRRDHLETTLPLMLSEFERVIVVDWSCPQESGKWAEAEGAEVVYKMGMRYFNAGRARNLGALNVESNSICFLDADTMVFPGLRKEVESLLDDKTMVVSALVGGYDVPTLCGFLAVDTDNFWSVGGYYEGEGYSNEDMFLRCRLWAEMGLKTDRVSLLGAIQHGNAVRAANFEEDIEASALRRYQEIVAYMAEFGIEDYLTDPRTADFAYKYRPHERP